MISPVRTTLDLDDDILLAAKELAAARRTTTGKVVSDLARQGLTPARAAGRTRNGVPLLPRIASVSIPVTMAKVNRLRDE